MRFHVRIKITTAMQYPTEKFHRVSVREWLGSIHQWIWQWEMMFPSFEQAERRRR